MHPSKEGAEGTTNIDKFRSTRCEITARNSVGALPKGPSEDIMITQEDIFGVNIGDIAGCRGNTEHRKAFQDLCSEFEVVFLEIQQIWERPHC